MPYYGHLSKNVSIKTADRKRRENALFEDDDDILEASCLT